MPVKSSERLSGAHHVRVALALAAMSWLAMSLQELLLFARPTPYGGAYVDHWFPYFCYALVYNLLGVMLVSAPMLLLWLVWYRRSVSTRVARVIHYTQLGLLLLTVALDHADNEVLRFMGIHLSVNLLRTYYKVNAWGSDMTQIFLTDRGVPGLPFVILIVVSLVLWWAGRRVIRRGIPLPWNIPWPLAVALCLVPLAVPLLVDEYRPPGHNRKRRLVPEIMTLYSELGEGSSQGDRPSRFETLAREYQAQWLRQSADSAWRFTDPERPFVREPLSPPRPTQGKPWNVIYIQLETFRGWNTGHLRPDVRPSATPFIDRLAHDTAGAFWRRHLSFGPPTISGFIAGHCSVKPHSHVNILTSFTYTALECLPAVLRRHGYRTELFTGSDPDWDNETVWLKRWYDDYRYYHDVLGLDRTVFRRAAERIRQLGREEKPFMATVVSISNHYPFVSREPQFTLDPAGRPTEAIRNTMRYTDDVVRELVESLQQEPWFAHTLVVITGDHGYSLGEHGPAGQAGGWRELVWVPLVIHGAHPRLPRGGHDEIASLLDIAPTVADLLDIREPTPWMGSSLVPGGRSQASFAVSRESAVYGERGRFSMVVEPASGRTRLFDALQDPLQQRNIAAEHPDVVAALKQQAEDERQLTNYLLEANLVWEKPKE